MTAQQITQDRLFYIVRDGFGRLRVSELSKRPRNYEFKTFTTREATLDKIERIEKEGQ